MNDKRASNEVVKEGRFLQKFIPARIIFVLLGFMGFNLVYAYKTVLSMSIIAMVKVNVTDENSTIINKFPGRKFDWDKEVQSQVLGAFFYGYVVTQIPSAVLATKFGGKWIFGCR